MLVYGIPEFRLPKDIVRREVDEPASRWGSSSRPTSSSARPSPSTNCSEEGFDAVFIATGAGLPQFMNVPGENLNGVYSANEFLTRVNLMGAYRFPEYDSPSTTAGAATWRWSAAATPPWTPSARRCASGAKTPTSLPPLRGGDARAGRGGAPRQGGGRPVP